MMNKLDTHFIEEYRERNAELEATNAALLEALRDARGAINSLEDDALGYATGDMGINVAPWPLREELLHKIDEAIRKATA